MRECRGYSKPRHLLLLLLFNELPGRGVLRTSALRSSKKFIVRATLLFGDAPDAAGDV